MISDKKIWNAVFIIFINNILENHFYFVNAPDYCLKLSLSWMVCVSSSIKVLSRQYEGPLTYIFYTPSLSTFIIYRKK